MVIQVNGKVRDKVEVAPDITKVEMQELAMESARIREFLNGGDPLKVIAVPPKLVNLVVVRTCLDAKPHPLRVRFHAGEAI